MSELIVRCSSIGRLMAEPLNADIDPEYMTAELQAIIAKTKRTDEEKSVLGEARRKSLSAGGKTHVRELVREAIFGFEPADIETRPIQKGRQVEGACIDMLARLTGRPLAKNAERRSNGLITGECDVFDAPINHGRDIKAPYSMATMPIVLADCYDSGYEWQMQGYNILWNAERWSVDYVLVSTPEELIGYEPPSLHYVDHIPEHMRWTTWLVERDRAMESLIVDKVLAARRYYRKVLNEFDRTHVLPGAAPAAPPWADTYLPATAAAMPLTTTAPAAELAEQRAKLAAQQAELDRQTAERAEQSRLMRAEEAQRQAAAQLAEREQFLRDNPPAEPEQRADPLLQDECRGLSMALAKAPHAKLHATEAAEAIIAVDLETTLTLGAINDRIAPLSITGAGLALLGFEPVATRKAAKLYRDADWSAIHASLVKRLAEAATG